MDETFLIYVDRLKKGGVEKLKEEVPPAFLDVHEEEMAFEEPVHFEGEAYLADDTLVLNLTMRTGVRMVCSICNKPVSIAINVANHYHCVPLAEVKTGVYSFESVVREAILLEAPHFVECGEGKCPERKSLDRYFSCAEGHETYRPFADQNFEIEKGESDGCPT